MLGLKGLYIYIISHTNERLSYWIYSIFYINPITVQSFDRTCNDDECSRRFNPLISYNNNYYRINSLCSIHSIRVRRKFHRTVLLAYVRASRPYTAITYNRANILFRLPGLEYFCISVFRVFRFWFVKALSLRGVGDWATVR